MSEKKTFAYYLLLIVTRPLAILPLSWHRALGRFIGHLMSIFYRKEVVMINLSRSFPEKGYDELKQINKKFYLHLGKVFAEAIWFGGPNIVKRLKKSKIVTVENPEFIAPFASKDKPLFVFTSHTSNWELYGGLASYTNPEIFGYKENDVCCVYLTLMNKASNAFFIRNRKHPVVDKEHYDGMLEASQFLRYALKHKTDNKFLISITDQYPYGGTRGEPIEFMGQSTQTMVGIPNLACKMGCPVVYLSYREKEDGNYTMRFSLISEDASKTTPQELVKEYYRRLELDLRQQPWNYLWTHKRWK